MSKQHCDRAVMAPLCELTIHVEIFTMFTMSVVYIYSLYIYLFIYLYGFSMLHGL